MADVVNLEHHLRLRLVRIKADCRAAAWDLAFSLKELEAQGRISPSAETRDAVATVILLLGATLNGLEKVLDAWES